jgi:hypothetical protein
MAKRKTTGGKDKKTPNERATFTSRNKRPRSAITSGRALFVDGDPNSAWSRRYHDLLLTYVRDISAGRGADFLCGAQVSLIRRIVSIECELERLDALLSKGQPIDLGRYGSVSGQLRRLLETLYGEGLKRKQKDVTPGVQEYLEATAEKKQLVEEMA